MSDLAKIDKEIMSLVQEKDEAIASYKEKIAAKRVEREAVLVQEKVKDMSEAERQALKAALEGDK